MKLISKSRMWWILLIYKITGRRSCDWKIIAVAADDTIDVNIGLKQLMIAVDSYAATNHLR